MNGKTGSDGKSRQAASMVLYCMVGRRNPASQVPEFLVLMKNGAWTFPPTKFRPREDLYTAVRRVAVEDLQLPANACFVERELEMLPNSAESPRYPNLQKTWHLYPVWLSLSAEGWSLLEKSRRDDLRWMSLEEIAQTVREPNVLVIVKDVQARADDLAKYAPARPSMDALAGAWVASHSEGVRAVRGGDIQRILSAGDRAFNLRVADPYLPYQKQGLGFTWSFYTPKDTQDIHVHGLPAVEVYGVMSGRLQLWHKPMNQRGVRTWRCMILEAGDWAEVEPLHCHFVCWLGSEGLGTVIKAAGSGPLAGVGRLGVAGKTSCIWKEGEGEQKKTHTCASYSQCLIPPALRELAVEFKKPYHERNYEHIARIAEEAQSLIEL